MRVERSDVMRATSRINDDALVEAARLYVLVNTHSAKLRHEDLLYARVLAETGRVAALPDGSSVTYAARLLGYGDIGRCPGPDLMEAVCSRAAEEGSPIFLLGGAVGVAPVLADALRSRHEGLVVAGTATPPFGEWPEEENQRLVGVVRESGASILFMGVSAPKQEIWAYEHLDDLQMPIVCVGAAFDFGTGTKSRAPRWMRKTGLEWVHRLLSEPGRMWKRYLVGNTLFIWDVIRYGRRPAKPCR
jgi:N-acetylglucosaminyldiphosphoundecaprenol N-acetyl-beta-D-mannosaminyltransferase